MMQTTFRGPATRRGDVPIDPLTEQSFHDTQEPMMTDQTVSNSKATLVYNDTAQSYQSFRPRLIHNEGVLEQINYMQPSDITKFSEKLYNNLFSQDSGREHYRNTKDVLLSQENIEKHIRKGIVNGALSPESISDKLNAEYDSIQSRKQQNQLLNEKQEMSKCTFKPKLNAHTQQIAKLLSPKSKVSPPRYMSPKQQLKPQLETKMELREVHSQRIGSEDKENVFRRLNRVREPVCTFTKTLQKPARLASKSRGQSPDPVAHSLRLYQDAFRPKKSGPQVNCSKEVRTSLKSKRLQMESFIKEFYKQITHAREWTLDNWQEQQEKISFKFEVESDLCLMTIDEMVYLLNAFGFLPISSYQIDDPENKAIKLFKCLVCPEGFELILSRNLLVFLLAVQGIEFIDQPSIIPKYANSYGIQFPKAYKNQLFCFDNGNLIIDDPKSLQKMFAEYYLSHLSYYRKSNPQQELPQSDRIVSQKTVQLAASYRKRFKSFMQKKDKLDLIDFQDIYKQKKIAQQEEARQREVSQCTFKPALTRPLVGSQTNLARARGHPDPKTAEQISFEKQQDQCTFTPDISRSQSSHQFAMAAQPQKEMKIVQRMVQGRVVKKAKQLAFELGVSLNKNKRLALEQQAIKEEINRYNRTRQKSSVSAYSIMTQQPSRTMTQRQSPKESQQPSMYIDVNLDDDKTDRIIVYEGDNPKSLAQTFSLKHNLDGDMQEKLVSLLEQQFRSVQQ